MVGLIIGICIFMSRTKPIKTNKTVLDSSNRSNRLLKLMQKGKGNEAVMISDQPTTDMDDIPPYIDNVNKQLNRSFRDLRSMDGSLKSLSLVQQQKDVKGLRYYREFLRKPKIRIMQSESVPSSKRESIIYIMIL